METDIDEKIDLRDARVSVAEACKELARARAGVFHAKQELRHAVGQGKVREDPEVVVLVERLTAANERLIKVARVLSGLSA